jgi:hypothetical protein
MAEYEEVEGSIEVPKNVGVTGFLKSIEAILKQSRVQSVSVDARGKVTYRRFVRGGEQAEPLSVDFETLQPHSIIRNSEVLEIPSEQENAAVVVGRLFHRMSVDQLNPVAFVGGANTHLWQWYKGWTGIECVTHDEFFGVPFFTDRLIEDHVLILCAAYSKAAALIDTKKSYKVAMQQVKE